MNTNLIITVEVWGWVSSRATIHSTYH